MAESIPPCIPYIGLVLQDLTFVHIGKSVERVEYKIPIINIMNFPIRSKLSNQGWPVHLKYCFVILLGIVLWLDFILTKDN